MVFRQLLLTKFFPLPFLHTVFVQTEVVTDFVPQRLVYNIWHSFPKLSRVLFNRKSVQCYGVRKSERRVIVTFSSGHARVEPKEFLVGRKMKFAACFFRNNILS